jgi:hypothetical protein
MSTNGTFVNGMKIWSWPLHAGDEIVFGAGATFRYGDHLESTNHSACRYRFFLSGPALRFMDDANPNDSIPPQESAGLCFICYGTIYIAQKLECGHRFCLRCIQRWARECRMSERCPVCPICRGSFSPSRIAPNDIVVKGNELLVWSAEAILRRLNITSCRKIKAVHIFKEWTDSHRKWFWQSFKEVSLIYAEQWLFLSLTKATAAHVVAATPSELSQAMRNLELGSPSETRSENVRKLLLYIMTELAWLRFSSQQSTHEDYN